MRLFILITCFYFYSCKSNPNSTLEIKINSSSNDSLKLNIKNMSESKIFYFFLKANKLSYLNNKNLYYSVKDSVINYNTAELPSFEFETPLSEFESASIPETEIKKPLDSIYKIITKTLNPNEEIQLQILFNNFDRNEVEPYGGIGIEFDNTLKKIQIAYTSDSTFVKQNISKELLDSLKENNIRIFHGTIYSNKMPLSLNK